MPQMQLPVFPSGSQNLTSEIGFECRDDQVTYFNGHLPVFTHHKTDIQMFRLITSQWIDQGLISQADVARCFGISPTTIKRCVKRYRLGGGKALFAPTAKRKGNKLTPERLIQAQQLLNEGKSVPVIGKQMGILPSTLHKAIDDGRLTALKKKCFEKELASTQSERAVSDRFTSQGVATQRGEERVFAALGLLTEAPLRFETCLDVQQGGVLCALPGLLAIGLLKRNRETFPWPNGFYPQESIFLAIAFMSLARIRSMEQLRYESPGEWGKILGLDRMPEVKTLREKIGMLCADPKRVAEWTAALARDWMSTTENPGFYYVDGHVRVYHGYLANRPKAFVSRERLCLRATMDYWINAMDGRPFFMVTQDLDPGLVETLQKTILPRLLTDVPNQPSSEALEKNPLLHRFVIIIDREGFALDLFKQTEEQRVAIITYAKFATENWPDEEFSNRQVTLVNGETTTLSIAERGVCLSNNHWLREVRRRDQTGHQTSIYSTDYTNSMDKIVAAMFARWCQENFFKYMKENYSLDRLVEYGVRPIPDTARVVNPAWRNVDRQITKERNLLKKDNALFAAMTLNAPSESKKASEFEQRKGALLLSIKKRQQEIEANRKVRKEIPYYVTLKDLPEEERFTKLPSEAKHFVDTIKLISYRAETAMVHIVRQHMEREEDARALLRQVFSSSVNLIPNLEANTLTIQVHPMSNQVHTKVLEHLCREITDTETCYPRTNFKMIFECLGSG